MNTMKKFLCSTLLSLSVYAVGAQQVLSLDSCRALAMANNKELLISQEKINAAHYQKRLLLQIIYLSSMQQVPTSVIRRKYHC